MPLRHKYFKKNTILLTISAQLFLRFSLQLIIINHETYTLICILRVRHVGTFRVTWNGDDKVLEIIVFQ